MKSTLIFVQDDNQIILLKRYIVSYTVRGGGLQRKYLFLLYFVRINFKSQYKVIQYPSMVSVYKAYIYFDGIMNNSDSLNIYYSN